MPLCESFKVSKTAELRSLQGIDVNQLGPGLFVFGYVKVKINFHSKKMKKVNYLTLQRDKRQTELLSFIE